MNLLPKSVVLTVHFHLQVHHFHQNMYILDSIHKQDYYHHSDQKVVNNIDHQQDCYNLQEHCKETAQLLAKFEESMTVEVEIILISRLWLRWTVC